MEYDDSSRRLNLLSGIVFGTLLGAGLALLLVPGDGVGEKVRFVTRGARGLGHAARRTHAYARDLRARLEDPADEPDPAGEPEEDDAPPRRAPRDGMARRRFTL